ncbi:hypothetical protein D6850_01555 [Roseovarius spongiae]|uniref:Thiol:disulfide interchange protein DsbD N-terminal domain-containing protein n=2 Tax=Roseovarius spongiae TaxID=2320272 RepID=A0A3A8AZW6_9RHOB|nr:hypothetical protein D6850_01555 [Roseovarius spongiae]
MIRTVLCSLACLATALAATFAHAAGSVEDVLEARLLPGWRMADGTHMAALEITLDPGWKTYWRAPGDLGIPPQFDWSGSRNLAGVEIVWPTPEPILQAGTTTIGYDGRVILPLRVLPRRAGRDVRLDGLLDLGVCRDVCIPVQLRLDADLPRTTEKRDPRIAAALADQPYSASEARVGAVRCTLAPADGGLRLHAEIAMPSSGGREFAVVETDNPAVWVAPAKAARKGDTLTVNTRMVHAEGRSFAVNRKGLRITVLGTSYAVDIQGCPAG